MQTLVGLVQDHTAVSVAIALAVCIVTAHTACYELSILHRSRKASILSGAVIVASAGLGVWATHFIAIIGYRPDLHLAFEPGMTVLSGLIGMIGIGIGLFVGTLGQRRVHVYAGGVTVSASIIGLHHVGMMGLSGCFVQFSPTFSIVTGLLGTVFAVLSMHCIRKPACNCGMSAPVAFSAAVAIIHFGSVAGTAVSPDMLDPSAISARDLGTISGIVVAVLSVQALRLFWRAAVFTRTAMRSGLIAMATEEGILSMDKAFRIHWSNSAVMDLLGLDPTGMRLDELLAGRPDAPSSDAGGGAGARRAAGLAPGSTITVGYTCPKGRAVSLDITIKEVRDITSSLRGYVAAVRDATAREAANAALKRSEEESRHLALVARHAHDSVLITDPRGCVEWINPAFEEMTGYTLGEVRGKKPGDFLQGALTDRATADRISLSLEAGAAIRVEIVNYTRAGVPYWIDLHIAPVRDAAGRVEHFIAVSRNIDDNKRRETHLREAMEKARAGEQAKLSFVSRMSHELRTPMNGIIGMIDLLEETDLNPEQRSSCETVSNSARVLLQIINDILDFSKLDAGKLTVIDEPFNLRDTTYDVADLLYPLAAEKGVEICVDYGSGLPVQFSGDAGRFQQCLLNVVGNAVKFTESGHVLIRVTPGAEGGLEIEISDTGIGIPEHKLESIFTAFEQVDDATTRRFDGTGLGLAITAQLVGLMGGTIVAESEMGTGATFRITFPFAEAPADDAGETDDAGKQAAADPAAALAGRHLLLVDDRDVIGHAVARIAIGWGMKVSISASEREARTLLGAGGRDGQPKIDCVLADHRFAIAAGDPADRGAAVFAALAKAAGPVPVLASAGGNVAEVQDRLKETGIAEVLRKPLRPETLRDGLLRAMNLISADARDSATAGKSAPATGDSKPLSGIAVLVAEDNKANQTVIRRLLERAGASVDIRENGQLVADAYRERVPDILLMDMSMPVMGGIEATRLIREIEAGQGASRCPIVALTANAMQEDRDRCLDAGMDDFLAKPVRKADLIETILMMLDKDLAA